jgi:hypothetical protein
MRRHATWPFLGCALFVLATPVCGQLQGNEQQELLSSHNVVRKDAEPTAVPALGPLTWSTTRASAAQSYANNCTFQHSPGAVMGQYGENLYASSNIPVPIRPTPATAVFSWSSEQQYYDYASNVCSAPNPPGTCGHYTQLVWRPSTQLGCGIKFCQVNSPFGPSFPDWYIWVCQYDSIQTGARPYLCNYGSGDELCISTRIFEDGFESGNLNGWGSHSPP